MILIVSTGRLLSTTSYRRRTLLVGEPQIDLRFLLRRAHTQCNDVSVQKRDNHTPHRTIRIPNELWFAARAKAAERGETLTDVITRALQRYVKR